MKEFFKLTSQLNKMAFLMIHEEMKNQNLSGRLVPYIITIGDNEGCSQDKLSKVMRIDKGCIAKTVKNLEEKGYVYREPDPRDKRGYRLYLTESSLELKNRFKETENKLASVAMDGMTDEEIATVISLLTRINENMSKVVDEKQFPDLPVPPPPHILISKTNNNKKQKGDL